MFSFKRFFGFLCDPALPRFATSALRAVGPGAESDNLPQARQAGCPISLRRLAGSATVCWERQLQSSPQASKRFATEFRRGSLK